MISYPCAASANRAIRAYFADFYGRISDVYNNTNVSVRSEVMKEIILLADRIKYLINKNESD